MGRIRDLLNRLERDEQDAVDRVTPESTRDQLNNDDLITLDFRRLFTATRTAQTCRMDDWGIWMYGCPIPHQLLIQPRLIVDFEAVNEADFFGKYGVTPDQFRLLAKQGFVIPNVYDFESQRKLNFAKYEANPYLTPLLEDIQGQCRINAIRRDRFFNCLGSGYSDAKEEGCDLFRQGLSKLV